MPASMKLRVLILLLILGGALGWLAQRPVPQAEHGWLDFLVANARGAFSSDVPAVSEHVVLVEFREEDKEEFSAWPPAPLDHIMLLKRLAEAEPDVVAFVEPLRWEKAQVEFITQLRNALVPFPAVVLGFSLAAEGEGMTKENGDFSANELPELPEAEGDRAAVPKFTRVVQVSDGALRVAAHSGFSSLHGPVKVSPDAVPFIVDDGRRLVPSLAAQSVMLFRRAPYAEQRLHFGTGARLSLGDSLIIPLKGDGSLLLEAKPSVPEVSALELMTPDLGDETSERMQATLGRHKAIVIGTGAAARQHARAMAVALAMPEIRRAPEAVDWGVAALAAVPAFWMLGLRRLKVVVAALAVTVVLAVAGLLVFQSSLWWWSPVPALAVVLGAALLCWIWPARAPATPAAA